MRWRRRAWLLAGLGTALAALAASAPALLAPGPLKEAIDQVRGYPAVVRRRSLPAEPKPFDGLAASQIGYGPGMAKRFSSPKPFRAFRVVRADGNEAVLEGGAPIREIGTDALGEVRTVWIGDFTALETPGRYRIVADNGLASHAFDVGPVVFDAAVRAVQRAFYYQRAFTAIESPHAEGPWVHASDAALAPPGVVKGWHDAGDFSIYSASMNAALYWLLSAIADFAPDDDATGLPESGNGVPDLVDEARWGLEWLLSVQTPEGGFRNTVCLEQYGPYGTNHPHLARPYRAGEVGTIATARAIGTLAFASALLRRHDPPFAERSLAAALRGDRFLAERPSENSDGPTCPAFRRDGDAQVGRDVRMYAAAGLFLATGDERHRREFESRYERIVEDQGYLRSNVNAALLYLRASGADPSTRGAIMEDLRRRAQQVRADGDRHPFGWAGRPVWGSIAAGFQRTASFNARECLSDPVGALADCEQVLANVHHALGRNYQLFVYVSGLPGATRARSRGFHHWLAALDASPYLFPGLVAAGPNASPELGDRSVPHARPRPMWGYWGDPLLPRDGLTPIEGRYTDNDSWSTNELDIDWQAVTLYNLYLARWHARGAEPRVRWTIDSSVQR